MSRIGRAPGASWKGATENFETGMTFTITDTGALKMRVCSKWLEARGFRTRIIERPFDSHFRCRTVEPQIELRLALCGFDSNPARRDLAAAGFERVMESGLGGTAESPIGERALARSK